MAQDIGSRIVGLRGTAGLSQEGLANELGLSRQAVSRWERGEALPDTENLIALADLFGVTLDELVRPKASAETDDGIVPADEAAPEEPAEPEAEPEKAAEPTIAIESAEPAEPEAAIPPPRPLWMKALLLVAAMASIALSALFVANVVTYVYHSVFPAQYEQYAADPIAIDASQVRSIDAIWSASEVEVVPAEEGQDGDTVLIQVYGPEPSPEDMGVRWDIADGRLRITCMPEDNSGETTVQVSVPADVALNLQELSIEATNGASGFFSSLTCDKIYVYESDGFAQFDNCEASQVDVHATSGDLWFGGSYTAVTIDAQDGANVTFGAPNATAMPKTLDAKLAESNLYLSVPDGAGLTLTQRGDECFLDTNLPIVYGEDGATIGSGETKVSLEADATSHVSITGTE